MQRAPNWPTWAAAIQLLDRRASQALTGHAGQTATRKPGQSLARGPVIDPARRHIVGWHDDPTYRQVTSGHGLRMGNVRFDGAVVLASVADRHGALVVTFIDGKVRRCTCGASRRRSCEHARFAYGRVFKAGASVD